VLSLTKILDYTSKIAVTCISALLIACEPLIFGGIAGLGGSSSFAIAQCSSGGPADLSGACRSTPISMGALEAIDSQVGSTSTINTLATTQQEPGTSMLNVTWLPYPGSVSGYYVYYGPTPETASTLATNLSAGTDNFDISAPSISYQPTLDLGLSTGSTVCFRILAYDTARVTFDWFSLQCTAV